MQEKGNITACFTINPVFRNQKTGNDLMGIFDIEVEHSEPGTPAGIAEAIMRQQNQVSLSILTGPALPVSQIVRGDSPQQVIGTQLAAGIESWLFYQALGSTATFGEKWMAKQIFKRAMFPTQVMIGAAAIGTYAAAEIHGNSTSIQKMASLGGVTIGSTQKRRMQSLGGL